MPKLNWNTYDIDYLIMHQVGIKPFNAMLKLFNLSKEKAPKTLHKFGNITASTIPANFDILKKSGKLRCNNKCLIIGGGSGVIISHTGYVI